MNTIYILFVMSYSFGFTQEFNTKTQCDYAAQVAKEQLSTVTYPSKAYCISKGELETITKNKERKK